MSIIRCPPRARAKQSKFYLKYFSIKSSVFRDTALYSLKWDTLCNDNLRAELLLITIIILSNSSENLRKFERNEEWCATRDVTTRTSCPVKKKRNYRTCTPGAVRTHYAGSIYAYRTWALCATIHVAKHGQMLNVVRLWNVDGSPTVGRKRTVAVSGANARSHERAPNCQWMDAELCPAVFVSLGNCNLARYLLEEFNSRIKNRFCAFWTALLSSNIFAQMARCECNNVSIWHFHIIESKWFL